MRNEDYNSEKSTGLRKKKKEIKNHYELNTNENTTCNYLWTAAKAVLRGKLLAHILKVRKKKKRSHISVFTFHLKKLEK